MFFPTLSSSSDMFDKTRSGRIDAFGFSALWDFMQRWRALFQQYDRDHSGSISAMELQQGTSRGRLAIFFALKSSLRVDRSDSTLAFLSPVLSSRSDGLQPEPPVFSDAGAALQRPRRPSRHSAGPLHSGLHAAAVHDAVLQREGHHDDRQHPHQLRGFPVWSHHQAHMSVTPGTVFSHSKCEYLVVLHR